MDGGGGGGAGAGGAKVGKDKGIDEVDVDVENGGIYSIGGEVPEDEDKGIGWTIPPFSSSSSDGSS